MTITGTLIKKLDVQKGTSKKGNEWQKQSIIIETEDQFKTPVCIDVMGDKIDKVAKMEVGNRYDISVNVGSREYNGKWYTNINGWFFATANNNDNQSEEDSDDLPF